MLKVPSKYRVARRLGAGVFDQTQTQKFALREANYTKKRGRAPSDYGRQLLEKQRVRFTYGLSEKQLSNYAQKAFSTSEPSKTLHTTLEMRADMVAYRAGLSPTRRSARQAVSHGHFTLNGKRITTPSIQVKVGDKLAVRGGNRSSTLYASLAEKNPENRAIPSWINSDLVALEAEIKSVPEFVSADIGLDYATVFEFYSR